MRYASIDIGTNTILMLIGDVDGDFSINRIGDYYEVPRVGKGVSTSKSLSQESMMRGVVVLERYREIALGFKVDRIIASATSAVREAENKSEFVNLVRDRCGIEVEVIDGPTEARLGYMGAVSGIIDKNVSTFVIDIGGGSTELSYGLGTVPVFTRSLDIGAVRLTEKFFAGIPPDSEDVDRAIDSIREAASGFPFSETRADRVFAVAGTATTLALIEQKRHEFDLSAVTNYEMTADSLRTVLSELRTMSPSQVRNMTSAAAGREDVLLAGALILSELLEAAGASRFLTSDRGLRYGYMLYKHGRMGER